MLMVERGLAKIAHSQELGNFRGTKVNNLGFTLIGQRARTKTLFVMLEMMILA